MGFFAELSVWLNGLLATFIADKTAVLAAALEPALITLATVYVMGWGVLLITGRIEEPLLDGLRRMARVVLIIGIGLKLWLYNALIVNTFFSAPGELAAVVIGSPDSVTIVDQIIFKGGDAASALIEKGGIFDGDFSYYLAGFFVYLAVGLASIYTIFLLSLAKIALSILLALGPVFVGTLLFQVSRRFFEAWIVQLANYAFIAVLATLTVALLAQLLTVSATQAAALGTGIDIATAVRVCFAAVLIFLVMRQVMPMAQGLAGGISLTSHNLLSRSLQQIGRTGTAVAVRAAPLLFPSGQTQARAQTRPRSAQGTASPVIRPVRARPVTPSPAPSPARWPQLPAPSPPKLPAPRNP